MWQAFEVDARCYTSYRTNNCCINNYNLQFGIQKMLSIPSKRKKKNNNISLKSFGFINYRCAIYKMHTKVLSL